MMMVIEVWYALLYVVVEGYSELQLSDTDIDGLLADKEKVDLLRRFRNAIFHYQADPFSQKLIGFLEAPATETWIQELHKRFDAFFQRELEIREVVARLTDEQSPD